MKRLLFILVLAAVSYSCRDTSPFSDGEAASLIGSSTYQAMTNEEDGAATPASTLAEGTQALFNATGGLTLVNQVMTYTNGQWHAIPQPVWGTSTTPTQLTALLPFLNNTAYTQGNIYDNGMLADVLYAQDTAVIHENIHLQFNHLFSMITFQLSARLQQKFQSITLSYPKKVTHIDPLTAAITTSSETVTATIQTASSDGRYSFIAPAAENIAIHLTVETTAKKYAPKEIASCTFVQGHETVYRVDSAIGISTTEDFIKFSQLINENTSNNEKTLEDFGETSADGTTTYYLLNDLDFKGVTGFEHIGGQYGTSQAFEHIFDGQGHTISNLTPASHNGTTGLFGIIGSNGVVKNLHMKSCQIKSGTTDGTAILAGINKGMISNCSVSNCNINISQESYTGGLAGRLQGTIINSYVKGTRITASNNCGSIAGSSSGNIINCYAANDTLISKNSGGISGISSTEDRPTFIKNCYVYELRFGGNARGLFYGYVNGNNSTIEHCFYTKSSLTFVGDGTATTTNVVLIDDLTVPLHQKLNEWIDNNEDSYPNLIFTRWKQGTTATTAIFLTE